MKNFIFIPLIALLPYTILQASVLNSQEIYKSKCIMCHTTQLISRDQKKNLIGPPIDEVMLHVKEHYESKDEAVQFIAEYIMEPNATKALCTSIDKFGVMPSMKSHMTEEEAKAVSQMIFDKFPREAFSVSEKKSREGITFSTIDANNDGNITSKEFQLFRAKRNNMDPESFKQDVYFQRIDMNGDGVMDKEEFKKMRAERMK